MRLDIATRKHPHLWIIESIASDVVTVRMVWRKDQDGTFPTVAKGIERFRITDIVSAAQLSVTEFGQAAFHVDLLVARGVGLGEPCTKQLSGKLRELRFYVGGQGVF